MKKNLIFSYLSLFCFLFLSACAQNPEEVVTAGLDGSPDPPKTSTTEPENVVHKKLDCGMLKKQEARDLCDMQIQEIISQILRNDIIESFDINRCKILSTENLILSCESIIESSGVTGPVSEDDLAAFRSAINAFIPESVEGETEGGIGIIPSRSTYNLTKCAELKAPGYKEYCENQIRQLKDNDLLFSIVSEGNISRCDELGTEMMKAQCRNMLGEPMILPEFSSPHLPSPSSPPPPVAD